MERKKQLSSIIRQFLVPVLFLGAFAAAVLIIVNYREEPEEPEIIMINGFDGEKDPYVMENEKLRFSMDPATTQFTVEVKETGKVWRSNPENAASDTKALPEERAKLQSPLLMSYAVTTGLEVAYNSFAYSIQNGIYEIEQTDENTIRVNYSLGNIEREYIIPPVTTKEAFDDWTSRMEDKGAKLAGEYYKKYDINKLGKKDDREALLASYPILADEVIYVLRDTTKSNTRKQLEELFEGAGYTYEDYARDKELDLSQKTSDKPVFNISMIYRLEGDDLVVEVPFRDLAYRKEYPIYTITPLPYFGAGSAQDEGSLLVPEGGGSLIHFNNGKTSQSSYYTNVYGWNMCLGRDAVVHNTRAYYGVYGILGENDSFLCILEDGSSYASVQADISGRNHSYNYVNAVYSVSDREKYDVGDIANSDIYQYVENLPDESIIQRYRFVNSGNYVDMAKVYGHYLQDMYGEALAMNQDQSTPVAVDIVGAVDKVRQILGVPVSRPLKLTTFAQAQEIIGDLSAGGVDNLSVRLTGWCNGGVKQKVLEHVKPVRTLGGQQGLSQLAETSRTLGVDLYLNGITQYAYDSNLLDGFFSYRDAAKFISKERAGLKEYSSVTYAERDDLDTYYLLHPDVIARMAGNLCAAADEVGANVSFEDTGMDLSADYYRRSPRSRQSVLEEHRSMLRNIQESGKKIMISMGNDYAAAYASMVTGVDLRGSEYTIIDECIPFYQLAVHGRVNYTGFPVNICGNPQQEILYSAEYGAGLYFTFMKESAFAIQKTLYTEYYGSSYDSWRDEMFSIYNRYESELGHTFSQEMTGHSNLSPTLSLTEYADGTKVYVNYGFSEARVDGITVPARDYRTVRQQ